MIPKPAVYIYWRLVPWWLWAVYWLVSPLWLLTGLLTGYSAEAVDEHLEALGADPDHSSAGHATTCAVRATVSDWLWVGVRS